MPTGPKGERRPADVIGNAVKVMRIATVRHYRPTQPMAALVERNPHALTLIPDHPKGVGQVDAIVNRRNSELILEQPAEMRRTAEAI